MKWEGSSSSPGSWMLPREGEDGMGEEVLLPGVLAATMGEGGYAFTMGGGV